MRESRDIALVVGIAVLLLAEVFREDAIYVILNESTSNVSCFKFGFKRTDLRAAETEIKR